MTSLDESGIFEERRQKVPECCKEICIKPLVWVTWIISERFFVTPGAPCPQKRTSKPSGAAWCCGGERCHSGCFVRGNGCIYHNWLGEQPCPCPPGKGGARPRSIWRHNQRRRGGPLRLPRHRQWWGRTRCDLWGGHDGGRSLAKDPVLGCRLVALVLAASAQAKGQEPRPRRLHQGDLQRGCWPLDRRGQEPGLEPDGMQRPVHCQRLQGMCHHWSWIFWHSHQWLAKPLQVPGDTKEK